MSTSHGLYLAVIGLWLGFSSTANAADPPKVVLIIHGGAGVVTPEEMAQERFIDGRAVTRKDYDEALAQALEAGYRALQGKTSIDAVEAAIRVLEDSELYNAGRGAVLTHDGRAELDAAIMEGRLTAEGELMGKRDVRKRAGAVTGVTHVKNPISAARAVMEMPGGRHMFMAGEGAERYVLNETVARKYRIEPVSNAYFWTDGRLKEARKAIAKKPSREGTAASTRPDQIFGTVGAVALDSRGTIAAGTSTGGLGDKWTGRIGDAPVIGAGTYADDRACGISCSGTGELFIRHAVAHDVVARMVYAKAGVVEAAQATMDQLPDDNDGVGALIALDHQGRHTTALSAKTAGMYRGYVTEAGDMFVAMYRKDEYRKMRRVAKDEANSRDK